MEGVRIGSGSGSGSGYGSGYGSGSGSGYGSGYGYGDGDGSGYGSGSGYGYGSGYGSGSGYGDGDGSGYGSGSGYGDGDGYGDGIKIFDGHTIEMIDGVQTIIDRAHGNFARGWILGRDLTLSPCCVVRNEEGMAAHGETMREAMTALMEKEMENRSPEERVEAFVACHDQGKKYPAQDLFEWHHHLTGSCLAGRKTFCRDHGIDIEHDAFTVEEFVRMTKGNYGADVIDLLAERIGMTDVRD